MLHLGNLGRCDPTAAGHVAEALALGPHFQRHYQLEFGGETLPLFIWFVRRSFLS